MKEICTYLIEIQGQIEEKNINPMSPYGISEVRTNLDASLFTIDADQSGLIGLIRYLHQQGYVLLSIQRERATINFRRRK